jgi:uncharacterized protein YdaU (DUF1376 family)
MHYYKRNLGDYAKKTGRLTMLQHGAYTLLIDSCYDRETFPTLEQAIEWTWASNEAEIDAVKFVLSRFFTLDKDGCYVQDRILQELLHYHANADTNKRIAIEREAKRKNKSTNREQDVNEAPPNHKPLTINQEPITINQKPKRESATVVACPLDVSEQVWQDWLSLRKAKKAAVTQTVLEGARKEAFKLDWPLEKFLVEWCTRGSQGLKAEWISDKPKSLAMTFAQQAADIARTTVPAQHSGPDPVLLQIEADRQKAAPMPDHIRQKINQVLRKI